LENLIQERLKDLGYACARWVAIAGCHARLAIFSAIGQSHSKMVFCVDSTSAGSRCDFLIPAQEEITQLSLASSSKKA
jgi:hypothetical protein